MKYFIFDEKEFDSDSEQYLFMAQSHVKHFLDIEDFLLESEKANYLNPTNPTRGKVKEKRISNLQYPGNLIVNMLEYCLVNLKSNDTVFVYHDLWNINDLVFQNGHTYYRYLWLTSA